jgi:Cd2+/Zn2+-exporting ATPase
MSQLAQQQIEQTRSEEYTLAATKSTKYTVGGMDCAHCAATVEKGVKSLDGVRDARVDFATGYLYVEGEATADVLRERVEALGYSLQDIVTPTEQTSTPGGVLDFWRYLLTRDETRFALAGGALIVLTLVGALLGSPEAMQRVAFTLAMLIALYPIARSGLRSLVINRDFNINLLMSIAAIGAAAIGETLEAATVIFLFAIGEALEGYTADRARDSLRGLMSLAPAKATRLITDGEELVPVEALRVNDMIAIKPGERIAMDGMVTAGESDVDQATITGESVPVFKNMGAEVFAGTVNGDGLLKVRVTRLAADNTLSRIIRLVEEAQSVRAPTQRIIDQFARVYTPLVVVIAALLAFAPPILFGAPFYDTPDQQGWLYRALSLLVIACPCALVISSPVTVISAITAAARRGVLIKGGAHLEALGQVRAFAFDKTGTLTEGHPVVTATRSIDCTTGITCAACDDVLALASAVERQNGHPLAKAVVQAAQERGLLDVYAPAESVALLTGRGVQGRVNDKLVTVGKHSLFDAEHPHHAEFCALVDAAEAQGQTAMLLCDGDRVRGYIAVSDMVRPDSQQVVADLKGMGGYTIMLTGDNRTVARSVGAAVGVDDVQAGLLPADKVSAVQGLKAAHGSVAMVGDGINDTPALAAATVGIAMGGAGSAQAMETADVVLMADGLRQLPFAVRLSRFAGRLLRENVAISLGTKLVFLLLALIGGASLWLAIFADVGVSLLVTLNGMRALRST